MFQLWSDTYDRYVQVKTHGLVVYLDANHAATWTDTSGNGYDYTLSGAPLNTGTGIRFTASSSQYAVRSLDRSDTNTVTVEVAFKVPTVTDNAMVFEHTANWGGNPGAFGALANSRGNLAASDGSTDNWIHTNSAVGAKDFHVTSTTDWAIYTFIYESGSQPECYYNGVLVSNTYAYSSSGGVFSAFANADNYLGTRGGVHFYTTDTVDIGFYRIYNRRLSAEEIGSNFDASREVYGLSSALQEEAIVRLDATTSYSGNNAVNIVTGAVWTLKGGCTRNTHLGVSAFDMETAACYMETAERLDFCTGPQYATTFATWIDWRDDNTGYRSMHRGDSGGHYPVVKDGTTELGVYSNAGGGWRPSGYSIAVTGWQLVISIAQDTDCTADGGGGGTTSHYIGTTSSAPAYVGVSDRSPSSGRKTYRYGYPGQGPGKVAQNWVWRRALTSAEMFQLWSD